MQKYIADETQNNDSDDININSNNKNGQIIT